MEKMRLIALCSIMMGASAGGTVPPGEKFTVDADEGENLVKRKFARELTDAEAKADAKEEADAKQAADDLAGKPAKTAAPPAQTAAAANTATTTPPKAGK